MRSENTRRGCIPRDFSSGSSTEAYSGSMVAPVREIAAQVFSVVLFMAPRDTQLQATSILLDLSKAEEWEVRHATLLTMKYSISFVVNLYQSPQH